MEKLEDKIINRELGKFTKGVERLVNPIDVGTLHFIQSFNNYIPKKIQKKMVDSSSKITPYMGFVVEPYSYFLCYEIKDLDRARSYLPEGFELIKTKIFDKDEPKYYGIFGCINAHTSGFWGLRIEFYIIAEDTKTGLMSWIIVDYDTNTITYDPKNALSDPNATGSIITIDYKGVLYADVKNKDGRKLVFHSDIKEGTMSGLDKRLWIEGNLSIAYGKYKIEKNPGIFSLIFDPKEFDQALRLSKTSLVMEENTWFPGLFEEEASEIVCFPYAQHFLSDSPGHSSLIQNEEELKNKVEAIDFREISVFSTKSFKKSFLIGGAVSILINTVLLFLVVWKI
jgi:hypothetical protein